MDNNQQTKEGGITQPTAQPVVVETAGPQGPTHTDSKTDLGVNSPSTVNVKGPFNGRDVSMTTPQYAGGNITTTEVGSV